MAGRGRGATLPAWMTAQGATAGGSNDNGSSNFSSGNNGNTRQFDDAPNYDRSGGNRSSNNYSSSSANDSSRDNRSGSQYDDRKRQRSRSPARDEPRGGGGGGWQPRAKRGSNFDVAPPEGMNVPPVGVSTGGANSSMSHHSNKSEPSAQTRHARRIYAGSIPQKATENEILNFFNDVVTKALLPKRCDSPPVVKIYLNADKGYAFVEFDSVELTTACLQLDGIRFDHPSQTTTIRVRRPNDYRPELLPPSGPIPVLNLSGLLDAAGTGGSAPANFGPNKIFIGGLPYNLADEHVMELLAAFGPIKNFHQVRDPGSATSKGYAFCEYFDQDIANAACQGLHGLQLGEKCLSVRIASTGANNATVTGTAGGYASGSSHSSGSGGHFSNYSGSNAVSGGYANTRGPNNNSSNNTNYGISGRNYGDVVYPIDNSGYGMSNNMNSSHNSNNSYNDNRSGMGGGGSYNGGYGNNNSGQYGLPAPGSTGGNIQTSNPTRVLRLSNMLTPQDLQNDAEIADIKEDVRLECIEHGKVVQVLIPRRKEGYAVEGMIFVEFANAGMARSAAMVLNGRKFADSTVSATYYDENRFINGILN